ncbi:MAG: hypothetical protein A2W99_02945 [Bacteroidetes bacterium GWF2_33_16]|nr:MAG: hypothetical protein A2X00_10070 [Bacteroidetes bacterium GWE2_32_14]OFY07909.1 MAG: hypothetical protein A2W99_02945 [Bacteroidetes bacterium GWF2_33_16]
MTAYKHLYIVRHGKSNQDFTNVPDYERPLKERGVNDSYKMASMLMQKKEIPQLIISSSAIRALHTAMIFARVLKYPLNAINVNDDLYMSSIDRCLEIIMKTDKTINSLLLFGHNPSFTDLANYFLQDKIDEIPTSGLVALKFETNTWSDIIKIKPTEYLFNHPKK